MAGRIGPPVNTLTLTFPAFALSQYGNQVNQLGFWNELFDLPTNGEPFKLSEVVSNTTVVLKGGSNISLPDYFFTDKIAVLVEIHDIGSIVSVGNFCFGNGGLFQYTKIYLSALTTAGYGCFYSCTTLSSLDLPELISIEDNLCQYCTALTTVNVPKATTIGNLAFSECSALTSISFPSATVIGTHCFYNCDVLSNIYLPSCINLGGTVGDDSVFTGITYLPSINLTIPAALMTCNSGNPDGDIQYLINPQQGNTVTITTV